VLAALAAAVLAVVLGPLLPRRLAGITETLTSAAVGVADLAYGR
jgi:hypothetical protein